MTALATPRHRVSVATAQMRAAAASVAGASVWSMDAAETAATLVALTRLEAQVAELKARVAVHADFLSVGAAAGATSTANWLAHQTKQTRPAAHRVLRLGQVLENRPATATALAAGEVLVEQAQVIVHALEQLPTDLDADLVARAERHLVAEAAHHDAKTLRIIGRRLLEVIAPDEADAHEAALLEQEEREAMQACRLTMTDDGHGKTYGRFTLPTTQSGMFKKMLLALAAPKHLTAMEGASVERRPGPERLGRAFCELIERYPTDRLPQAGGVNATVVVTMTLETLEGRLEQAGILDTGERISPGQARRLACEAAIIPAVLGGKSEVLDLGLTRRFHSKAQRLALAIRDQGCSVDGCDWPPGLCHAHHDIPWSRGGSTDLANGRLLCPKHHAMAHAAYHRRT
jgi:hypothetical protein